MNDLCNKQQPSDHFKCVLNGPKFTHIAERTDIKCAYINWVPFGEYCMKNPADWTRWFIEWKINQHILFVPHHTAERRTNRNFGQCDWCVLMLVHGPRMMGIFDQFIWVNVFLICLPIDMRILVYLAHQSVYGRRGAHTYPACSQKTSEREPLLLWRESSWQEPLYIMCRKFNILHSIMNSKKTFIIDSRQ